MASLGALARCTPYQGYTPTSLKIGVHLPFGPKFPVEFVALEQKIVGRPRGCVHSTYARFWPFLTHPSPLYAFHTLRLDPSLSYIHNWLTHPPYRFCQCAFSKTLVNIFSYKESNGLIKRMGVLDFFGQSLKVQTATITRPRS